MSQPTLRDLFNQWEEDNNKLDAERDRLSLEKTAEKDIAAELNAFCQQEGIKGDGFWMEYLAKPVAEAVAKKGGYASFDCLGPFGICAKASCCFFKTEKDEQEDNGELYTILVTNLAANENGMSALSVKDFSQKSNNFPKGSIGEINGVNIGEVEVPMDTPIDELYDFFKQISDRNDKS